MAKSLTAFTSNNIYFCTCQKADEKKGNEDEKPLEEFVTAKGDFLGQRDLFKTQYPLIIKNQDLNKTQD